MANFQVFQTIYHTNFCISTGIKTTANFLITDIETASFIARDCKLAVKYRYLLLFGSHMEHHECLYHDCNQVDPQECELIHENREQIFPLHNHRLDILQ